MKPLDFDKYSEAMSPMSAAEFRAIQSFFELTNGQMAEFLKSSVSMVEAYRSTGRWGCKIPDAKAGFLRVVVIDYSRRLSERRVSREWESKNPGKREGYLNKFYNKKRGTPPKKRGRPQKKEAS